MRATPKTRSSIARANARNPETQGVEGWKGVRPWRRCWMLDTGQLIAEADTMETFVAHHRSLVTAVLSGFDRLVFRGSLLPLMRKGGVCLPRAVTLTALLLVSGASCRSSPSVEPDLNLPGCSDDESCPRGEICVGRKCVVGCSSSRPCEVSLVCDPATKRCVECVIDADCRDSARPRCDLMSKCVECLPESDNCPAGQVCTLFGPPRCVSGCKSDVDCLADGGHPRCDPILALCVPCLTDADCPPDHPCLADHHCCFGCVSDSNCGAGQVCCKCMCIVPDTVENCGICGMKCPSGQRCCAGTCRTTC